MYQQTTAPAPVHDLPPVVAPASVDSVSVTGPPPVVPAVVHPHVVLGGNAYSANGTFCTSHVQTSPGCSDVGGNHLEECVYLHD